MSNPLFSLNKDKDFININMLNKELETIEYLYNEYFLSSNKN